MLTKTDITTTTTVEEEDQVKDVLSNLGRTKNAVLIKRERACNVAKNFLALSIMSSIAYLLISILRSV